MTLRVVTLAGDPETEAAVAPGLAGKPEVELILRCVDRVELLAALRGADLDAVVAVGAPGWFDAAAAAEARAAGVRIVGVATNGLEAEILTRLGASMLEASATTEEIVAACSAEDLVPSDIEMPSPAGRQGRVVAVWGPKGAPGRTTLAVELACELAASSECLLVDADPYGGDILQALGVVEELPTVLWAAALGARGELVEKSFVKALRRVGEGGPRLLPGLPRPDLWAEVTDFGWCEVLDAASAAFVFSVFDVGFCLEDDRAVYPAGPAGRNRMTRMTIERADRVVAVCRGDPLGVKNFIWAYQELRRCTDPDKVLVVVNRMRSTDEQEVRAVLKAHVGRPPAAIVPERPQDFARALAEGRSMRELKPGSEVSAQVRIVADALGGKVRSRGLLARLAGRA